MPLVPELPERPDLTLVCARAVSAGHMAYLMKMGIQGSFSMAIIVNGYLAWWG